MPSYQYQAQNAEQQTLVGQIQADSVAEAVSLLEARGLSVQSIGLGQAGPIAAELASSAADVVTAEQAALRSHMQQVLVRSVVMLPALRAFAEEFPDGRRRRQLGRAISILERGDVASATADLARLPEFWVPLLSASAASHDPGQILSQFLDESQRASELRRQWWQALAYPAILALFALALAIFLSIVIVPMYRQMFVEFDLPLPRPTFLLLQLSEAINNGTLLLGVILVAVGCYVLYRLRVLLPGSWQTWWSDHFGTPLGRSTAVARLAAFCADLMQAGVPTPTALRVAGHCAQSPRLQRAAWRLANDVERDEGFPSRPRPHPLTRTVVLALRGELAESARIRVLRAVGQSHAERADARLSWKHGLMEPLAVVVAGLIVGGTVLALFFPLITLIRGLSGG